MDVLQAPIFTFEGYGEASKAVAVYNPLANYKKIVVRYVETLSEAIERLEEGATSIYVNVFDSLDLYPYYKINNCLLKQAMHGYLVDIIGTCWRPQRHALQQPNVAYLDNEAWFRMWCMILINFKVTILVYSECDMNGIYPEEDIHDGNATYFAKYLKREFQDLNKRYSYWLNSDAFNLDNWPYVRIKSKCLSKIDLQYSAPQINAKEEF
ncbi:hypothetical protein [Thysanoplusia orichalcea nucleopolyhedrovirus]|uniref:Uncharacterized protein n=1 Tax=Thysanoplusia orichalcea nucleopolyhedrovirus TaxID=101850 RepID=L0CJV1_9ABAC|nr:hypothetical protein [Thysanoplusia orichalcea nucleopolyhedrovirus]AGA16264.1 hypothetical protein [Thysanoplusia orichalcea nucleopolyhedrovirus]